MVNIAVGLMLLFLNCWNKQDHGITQPDVPRYTLSGVTLDFITNEPVPNSIINIQAVQLVYDIAFPSQTLQSDSAGHYSIDPVYPGSYIIRIVKNGCLLNDLKLTIEHTDRDFDLYVPEIRLSGNYPMNIKIDHNSTFKIANNPCFSIFGKSGANISEKWVDGSFAGLYFCNTAYNQSYWVVTEFQEILFDPSKIRQLEISDDHYYAIEYSDSLLVFDKFFVDSPITFELGIYVKDIAFNQFDRELYACTDSLLYRLDVTGRKITQIAPFPTSGMTVMTWYENNLYLYNKQENLLYQLDLRLQVVKVYAVVNKTSNTLVQDIYDLHFDVYNNLWVTTQ